MSDTNEQVQAHDDISLQLRGCVNRSLVTCIQDTDYHKSSQSYVSGPLIGLSCGQQTLGALSACSSPVATVIVFTKV